MKLLFVDDDPNRLKAFKEANVGTSFEYARLVEDAVRIFEGEKSWDIIYLDHDMDDPPHRYYLPNGTKLARHMVEEGIKARLVVLQSLNPDGRKNMYSIFKGAGYNVIDFPFAWKESLDTIKVRGNL